jgi:RND family efflux transporter MFP subunit
MADLNNSDLNALRIDQSKKFDDRPRSKVWKWLFLAVLLAVVVVAYFLLRNKVAPATKVKASTVTYITGSASQASLVASGYVVAQRKAEVASKGTGRLKYLGFEEGDTVHTGQVIAELENDDIKAEVALAKANLMNAEADSLNAGRIYRRQQKLYDSSAVTRVALEDAETTYLRAKASVAAAQANVEGAEVNLENTIIRAPFSGTVLTKNADVGEVVAPFASSSSSKGSVVTLADMGSLEVEADVSESNIYKVFVGQKCNIVLDAYPDRTYAGEVKKIVPTADRARATVLTKVAFTNIDNRVLPEMSARVNFFPREMDTTGQSASRTLVVDKEAITTRAERKVVFRIVKDKVELVPIVVGRRLGDMTEIDSGLSEGDRVVLSPPGKMATGDKIEVTP